jgi:DNA-binding MarR family transcriptional regulator
MPGVAAPAHLPARLVHSPSFLLPRLAAETRRRLAGKLAEEGLKLGDYGALVLLQELESAPQQTLARLLGIDRSNLVEIIDRLEAAGAAERRPDPADRRRYAVRLTGRGREILERCAVAAREVDDDLLRDLDGEERRMLMHLLGKVAACHDEHVSLEQCVAAVRGGS